MQRERQLEDVTALGDAVAERDALLREAALAIEERSVAPLLGGQSRHFDHTRVQRRRVQHELAIAEPRAETLGAVLPAHALEQQHPPGSGRRTRSAASGKLGPSLT